MMAVGDSRALRYPHDFKWQPRPWTIAWPLVVTQATDIYLDPDCGRAKDPVLSWAQT